VPHEPEQEAIREMVAMNGQGLSMRAIAVATQRERGHQISRVGVQGALRTREPRELIACAAPDLSRRLRRIHA
jgi:hypothetical protein